MVGLNGAERKLPGEISGGMRKRAGLARALVLDPEIILFDEPDSGLDPVRAAYLNQLIIDLNAQTDSTFLIVTHDIGTARTVPDNLGLLFRRELVMFGPREVLLTSEEPVVKQFLNGRREGPIGMSEEKDAAQVAAELASLDGAPAASGGRAQGRRGGGVPPQLQPSPGLPERKAAERRKQRVLDMLHTLPDEAQAAISEPLAQEERDTGRRAGTANHGRQRADRLGPVPPDGRLGHRRARPGRPAVRAVPGRGPADLQAAVPGPRVHRAGLVHRQRDDPADRAGGDPVRRGDRAAAGHADPPDRRPVVHRRGQRAGDRSARPARSCARC